MSYICSKHFLKGYSVKICLLSAAHEVFLNRSNLPFKSYLALDSKCSLSAGRAVPRETENLSKLTTPGRFLS